MSSNLLRPCRASTVPKYKDNASDLSLLYGVLSQI